MTEIDQDSRRFRVFHPAFLGLVSAAVLLRLGLSFALPRAIKWDESTNLLLGYNLLTGNGYTYSGYPELHFPPLHPIFAGLCWLLTRDFEMASNLENALFGGFLLLPVFLIARRIYGVQTAWVAATLLAIFPPLTVNVLYWGGMSEPLFLLLLFGGLALLLTGLDDNRIGMFTAAGALLGLAYLTREEAIVFFGIFLIFASAWLWKGVKICTPRTWYALALFALPFVLLAAPYILYLHAHTGQWMISGKTNITWEAGGYGYGGKSLDHLYNDLDSSGKEINWLSRERFQASVLQNIFNNPGSLVQRVIRHGYSLKNEFFATTSFWWGFIPLVAVGLFKQPWSRRRLRYEVVLITIILVLMLVFLPFGFMVRYFATAYPVLLMWTSKGALELGGWLQDTVELWRGQSLLGQQLKAMLGWLPACIATLFLILTIPVAADRSVSQTFFGYKEAGLWLKAHTVVDAKVMTKELAVALYADRGWVPSPNTDWIQFIKYARVHDASYLVVRDYRLEEYRPELASVLHKDTPELDLVFSFQEPHRPESIRTLVYRISKASEE
ncbi:MAG: ArnT family glycosyltransferase [Nitrospira sp.]